MRPRRSWWLLLALALGACARSCSCEDGSAVAKKAPPPAPEPVTDAAPPPQDAAQLAAAEPAPAAPIDTHNAEAVFPDLPSPQARQELGKLAGKLGKASAEPTAKLAPRERLGALLPQRIRDFDAKGAAVDGASSADDKPMVGLARHYVSGKRELYVKITDTLKAPALRSDLLAQLGVVGPVATGFLHGRMIAGYPGTAQYYPNAKNAQVTLLVAARYLVELRLVPAASALEAIELAQRLPLAGFGAPETRVATVLRDDPSRATAVSN